MFGLGQPHSTEEELKEHQEQTKNTVIMATYAAALLWASPMIWNLIRKQWK